MASREIEIVVGADLGKLRENLNDASTRVKHFGTTAVAESSKVDKLTTSSDKLAKSQGTLKTKLASAKGELGGFSKSADTMKSSMGRASQQADKLGTSGDKVKGAFGASARQGLGQYITSLGSVAAAAGIVTSGIQAMRREAERGISAIGSNEDPNMRLAQIAGPGQDLERMKGQADAAAIKFGLGRDDMRRLMFSAASEGFRGEFGDVADASQLLGRSGDAAGKVAGSFRGLFKGRQNLTVNQALSGVLTGATDSRLDFAELAKGATLTAESSNAQGTSAEEVIGATSVLASRFGGAEATGARLRAFQARMSMFEETRGEGIVGAAAALHSVPPERRKEIVGGSSEVRGVLDFIILDKAEIRAQTKKQGADLAAVLQGGGTLARQRAGQETQADFLIGRDVRSATARRDITTERDGMREMARRAAVDTRRAENSSNRALNFAGGIVESLPGAGLLMGRQSTEIANSREALAQANAKGLEAQMELQRRQLVATEKQTAIMEQNQPTVIETVP